MSALLPYGFEYAMMGGSVMLLLGGVVILVCLTEHPHRVGEWKMAWSLPFSYLFAQPFMYMYVDVHTHTHTHTCTHISSWSGVN